MNKITKNGRILIRDEYFGRLEGSFQDIVDQLIDWSNQSGVDLHDVTYESWDECGTISYWRDMTEKEKEAERIKKQKSAERSRKIRETKEAKERAEFERLKKKYG